MMKKLITAGFIALTAMSLTGCQNLVQNDPVECTVVDKDRSTSSDGDGGSKSVFRIYTEGCGADNETLGLADNIIAGNWNASDMYAKIKVGEKYTFKTVGVRNGFLSSFREITSYTKVAQVPTMQESPK
jgi:hypothetical protein